MSCPERRKSPLGPCHSGALGPSATVAVICIGGMSGVGSRSLTGQRTRRPRSTPKIQGPGQAALFPNGGHNSEALGVQAHEGRSNSPQPGLPRGGRLQRRGQCLCGQQGPRCPGNKRGRVGAGVSWQLLPDSSCWDLAGCQASRREPRSGQASGPLLSFGSEGRLGADLPLCAGRGGVRAGAKWSPPPHRSPPPQEPVVRRGGRGDHTRLISGSTCSS